MENKKTEIEKINYKYQKLISKAFNDTTHINLNEFFDIVLPQLIKEREKEISNLEKH